MRVNEATAVSTSKVLLVPYDAHHVERYHEWMQNEDLRAATASDLLTLAEEYENQQSWRTAHDKLTFIVCQPAVPEDAGLGDGDDNNNNNNNADVVAGRDDEPARMVGDVNLFLTPCDSDDDEDEDEDEGEGRARSGSRDVKGEIDIMIAAPDQRRRGLGEAAVRAFLRYLAANRDAIMDEYAAAAAKPSDRKTTTTTTTGPGDDGGPNPPARLTMLVAKINAGNAGSIRLFGNLGFRRRGEPNYFNEVSMVLSDFPPASAGEDFGVLGYGERFYDRSRLEK